MLSAIAFTLAAAGLQAESAPCQRLATLALPDTTITAAVLVPAGPPGGPGAGPRGEGAPVDGRGGGRGQGVQAATALPEHCRVVVVLAPSADSHIEAEIWLPTTAWNGKFQAVGNGGWAGAISYGAMAGALTEGYAVASTDTGHAGGSALFAIDAPEQLVDFAHRAVHEMTVQSKSLIAAYYGRAPRLSYWNGCSTGGRQGLMSAQRYPSDFDAILAGAPANNQTRLHAWDLSVAVPALRDPAAAVPPETLELVNRAVVAACDADDGVVDGLLTDPRACTFDVAELQCRAGAGADCLTAPQVASVRRAYAPATTSDGRVVFPGKVPGSETGLGGLLGGQRAPGVSVGSFQVAYGDPGWDPLTFDLDRDLPVVDQRVGALVNAVDPDLRAFKARGGKLLLFHGWNDTAISPGNAIDYYESVLAEMGPDQDDWMRLFMAPGMGHCGGGVGPNQVNWMGALERWRESDAAPDRIEAVHVTGSRVDMTRPLCPYPKVATYAGVGSTSDAASFVCRAP
jgi:feruloyl esterase